MGDIRTALHTARSKLAALPQADAALEAELLLAEAMAKPRVYLTAWPERALSTEERATFQSTLQRRLKGEPIAYILGHREFWSLDLQVNQHVLIPRPETELLVELALDAYPADTSILAADLGTGSGAIAAALARERPHWRIIATDLSDKALAVAQHNFRRHGFGRVECRQGHWCAALGMDERLQLIVSNPPYVEQADPHLEQGDPRFEPRTALAAGPDGLDDFRRITEQAPAHLQAGGRLMLEHGWNQGAAVRDLLLQAGFEDVRTHRDLAGQERASEGVLAGCTAERSQ